MGVGVWVGGCVCVGVCVCWGEQVGACVRKRCSLAPCQSPSVCLSPESRRAVPLSRRPADPIGIPPTFPRRSPVPIPLTIAGDQDGVPLDSSATSSAPRPHRRGLSRLKEPKGLRGRQVHSGPRARRPVTMTPLPPARHMSLILRPITRFACVQPAFGAQVRFR